MAGFLAFLLKFLPILLSLFGILPAVASYHALGGVSGNVGVNGATLQYVGGYSALAVAGAGIGEWLRGALTNLLTGGMDITKLLKMVQLIMALMTLVKSDPKTLALLEEILGFKLSSVPNDEKSLVRLLMER